jgi:hypothetical protein
MGEKRELRKAITGERQAKRFLKELQILEKKGEVEQFNKREVKDLHKILMITHNLSNLLTDITIDFTRLKTLLQHIYNIDLLAEKADFPNIKEDESEVKKALIRINKACRDNSDMLGALTN